MEIWKQVLLLTLTPISVTAVVAYLVKVLINQSLNRDLEKFKKELDIKAREYEVEHSIYYQRKAEVLSLLFEKMDRGFRYAEALVQPLQPGGQNLREKKEETFRLFNELNDYFYGKKIFLEKEFADTIQKLIADMRAAIIEFSTDIQGDEYQASQSGGWHNAYQSLRDQVKPVFTKLENDFRFLVEPKQGKL